MHPDVDFQRTRKISARSLISFLVSQGSSSTRVEMLDFWGIDADSLPTSSALNQQRQKLKPNALEAVFRLFNSSVTELLPDTLRDGNYRFLAADGSTFTYFSSPSFSPDEYYCSPGNSIRGVYSMHLNAFYDLTTHTYTDALIQPVHYKNEFGAFCDMVDRHVDPRKKKECLYRRPRLLFLQQHGTRNGTRTVLCVPYQRHPLQRTGWQFRFPERRLF